MSVFRNSEEEVQFSQNRSMSATLTYSLWYLDNNSQGLLFLFFPAGEQYVLAVLAKQCFSWPAAIPKANALMYPHI